MFSGIIMFICGLLTIYYGYKAGNIQWCIFGAIILLAGVIDDGLDTIANKLNKKD